MRENKTLFIFFLPVICCLLSAILTGCVTVPSRPGYSTYNLHGAAYISLAQLCNSRGIDWQYDIFTQTVTLQKGLHHINMRIQDTLILVDGAARRLERPVDIYNGMVVVPYSFKERTIDSLFSQAYSPSSQTLPSITIKKVVIDAGHGGKDAGAIGRTGLREKDVNLDIAKRLARLLREKGIEVVMTRISDIYVSLEKRVAIANNSGADIFISIHSNANRVRSLSGFEVYYVSSTVSDSRRAISAATNVPLRLASASFASNSFDLKAILWDMIYTANRAESIELARSICRKMDRNGVKVLGVKAARFEVLRGARMPAVLIEVGFVSNLSEERMLRNSYFRERISETIVAGIQDYSRNCELTAIARKR
ncbi:MAG: N-acetylmuramoyl-L-alanine amidase [Candidatus Omnitrophica bacterium]|nr:N-acetylmuramoyl-L-alanine amidase [Candidatus Omnitrophota bacterium]